MPCILKQRTPNSPGIIVFTHNEALRGLPVRSRKVRQYLEATAGRLWIYGVHIQGDCSAMERWPLEPWQAFILWPEVEATFLDGVPLSRRFPLNCINFIPDAPDDDGVKKLWDICVISRAAPIKRITETLYIMRGLLDARPDLRFIVIVPDPRDIRRGIRAYKIQEIERNFFELPLQLFSSRELQRISFICPSTESFGKFPVSPDLIAHLLRRCRFLLLTSHSEGTPRALAEALVAGTPCIVSKSLRCGILRHLTEQNSLFVDENLEISTKQILEALDDYDRFHVDSEEMKKLFSETYHRDTLRNFLSNLIMETGYMLEGEWYLDNLHHRLCGHGHKFNLQFLHNENLFFEWLKRIEQHDPYDEDIIMGNPQLEDIRCQTLHEWLSAGVKLLRWVAGKRSNQLRESY